MIDVFLAIALIVCFVAVIIYSPLVSGRDNTRIQQLEGKVEQLQAMQGTNCPYETLQESLESLEAQVQRQSDRLRTINLYEGCINETTTCQLSSPITTYRACGTGFVIINRPVSLSLRSSTQFLTIWHINPIQDTQYFTSSILCDFSYNYGLLHIHYILQTWKQYSLHATVKSPIPVLLVTNNSRQVMALHSDCHQVSLFSKPPELN